MKIVNKSANGTSFHDITIVTTVNALIEALGHPQYFDNFGDDKVNFEWVCENKEGKMVTIYDWKEYRSLGFDEEIEFHLGGQSKMHTLDGKLELKELLNK